MEPLKSYDKEVIIRWGDLDPNFHVLHSKYYDFGAYSRMSFFTEHGLTPALMKSLHFGPVIFREECFFRREINFGDKIMISFALRSHSKDFSRWSIEHTVIKNGDIVAAQMNVDGAWLDTALRKLMVPPGEAAEMLMLAPRSKDFSIT